MQTGEIEEAWGGRVDEGQVEDVGEVELEVDSFELVEGDLLNQFNESQTEQGGEYLTEVGPDLPGLEGQIFMEKCSKLITLFHNNVMVSFSGHNPRKVRERYLILTRIRLNIQILNGDLLILYVELLGLFHIVRYPHCS